MKKHSKPLIDNYDKKCHLLALEYNNNLDLYVGICSLCGTKNSIYNIRCSHCRAQIEEDSAFF